MEASTLFYLWNWRRTSIFRRPKTLTFSMLLVFFCIVMKIWLQILILHEKINLFCLNHFSLRWIYIYFYLCLNNPICSFILFFMVACGFGFWMWSLTLSRGFLFLMYAENSVVMCRARRQLSNLTMASSQCDILVHSETLVSCMHHVSELLVPDSVALPVKNCWRGIDV